MKRIYIVCIVLFCVFRNTNLFAQVASVKWPLTSNQNPNTPIGNIQALPQSIGTPTSSYVLAIYPNQPYTSRGQQLWTGNQGTGWIAGPPDYTRYMQLDASPDSGNDLSVQYISFNYSDTENPTNTDFHILKGEVWYAIDNNWNNSVQINSSPLDYLSSAIQTFSVNVNVLVQNGQTFSLRIYPYAPNGGRAMTPSFAVHKNVIIEGRTTPVVLNTGSICGMKFNDLNGNGRKDSGELGLAGWTINLSMGAVNKTATTGADGSYCFNDLPAGTYTLYETPQGGWQQTYPTNPSTHTVVLPAGQTILNVDFGNMQYGSVGGMKFNDLDGDGEKDEGEPGISGWIIALTMGASPGGDGVSITTDENGEFHFVNVPPGVYTLQELQQGGWDQTYPDSPGTYILTITSGLNLSGKDFGNKQLLGSICGMKFNDLNGNGINDNEPGLSGWIIELTYNGPNGVVTLRDTTDSNGEYCFNNLPFGNYTITEVNKSPWTQTAPASGSYTVTINQEVNLIGYDFGNKEVLNPNCTDFENNSLNGWQANNISTSFQQNGNNHYIQTTDQAGVSTFYTTSKPYTGNWTSLFANGCGSLNFDVTFIYGGDVYNGVTPPQTLTPYIAIEGNGFTASFVVNQQISVGDGWHTYSAPLSFLNSDGTLPSNSDGHWVMVVGTANDWNSLLTNVTKVRLLADPTSYQGEKIGYDNICLKNTGDCNSPDRLGSICGFKILDKDGDGVRDSNEDIIPNWGITLTDGTTTYTATTGADGQYCFNNLPAGTYTVAEEHRTGFRQIFPPAPGVHTITLLPGENKTNINFSNVEDISTKLGSICGKKFNDINGDGDQDLPNEVGLPGWTFQLTGGSIQTVVTDLNGDFCFTNLRAGTYTIKEVIQDGWEPTAPNTTGIFNITLLEGENREGIFFGNKEKLGSICGVKYNDVNNNGKRDPGELGIPNFEITLDIWGTTSSGHAGGPTLTHIASVITDQNGIYCFNNVRQGNYLVGEIQKDGFTKTEPSGFAHQITLTAGQKIEGLNFGNRVDVTVRLGSICGIKFNDKDGDGVQDPGELGIPEWQINIGGAVDKTVVTDKEGKFCFDNLPPGEYKVGEKFLSGWRQTKPLTNFYIVQLASGQKIDLEFGNTKDDTVQLGSICGTKFNDKNRDGRKVDGEPRIAGWIIYLEGPMNLTAVTDKNGDFCFYGLIPGTYTVREKNEKGWRQTKPSSITYTLEVGNGDNFTQIDFGNFEDPTVTLGSICGMKFNDLNGDGRKQDNEPVIENWTINLSGTMNLTTRTDARGKFCFDNLRFGRYTLAEAYKDRWRQTAPSTGSYTFELSEDNSNPDTFYFGNKYEEPNTGCVSPPSGMVGWWTGDNNANDISGFNNHGTLQGGATYVSGKVANAFNVSNIPSNVTDYISIPDNSSLNFGTGNFSIDAWVKTTNTTGGLFIVSKVVQQAAPPILNSVGYILQIAQGGILSLHMGEGSVFMNYPATGVQIADGKWHFVAATVDRKNKTGGKLYVDGNIVLTFDPTTVSNSITNTSPLLLAKLSFGSITPYENQVDEVEIFNRVITPDEIASIFNAGSDGKCKTSIQLGSICGMKFNDKNGNGRKDDGEDGIYNWQINLGGPTDLSISTDRYGKYCFDNLKPGVYVLKEELKENWTQTYPSSPNSYTITLTAGQRVEEINFGNKYEPKIGCVDPPSGMVAWWSLDLSTKDSQQDLAGYNNVGTKMNATAVAGKVLGALQFDGVDDYVEVADHSELNFGTSDFSFDAWIKTAENGGLQTLVSKRASTGYAFFLNSGNLGLTLSVPSIAAISFVPSVFVADGNWHHIAVTVSRTNKQGIIFYVDGVATPYGDPTPYQGSLTNSALLMIGKQQPPNPSFNFKGILDEIELFKRVLTPQEVQAIYNAGSAGKCKPDNSGGSVSGTVWYDRNHNGIMDPNEVGLAQLPVLLNGQTIAQIETNNDGNFVFTDCKPGDYTLSVGYQNNWSGTYPRGGRYSIKLEEGQRIDGLNFGFADDPCPSGQKTWSPLGSGTNWYVRTLAANENVLYAGGWFSVAGGISVNKIAKWNGSSWEPLVDINNPLVFNDVNELAIMNGELYASVEIQLTTNSVGMRIAKWDGQNWSVIGNGHVFALTTDGASLFASGSIPITGFNAVYNVVKWNGLSLLPLVSSNSSTGFNSAVYALAVMGGELYAAGNFTTVDGISANHIAKWNGNNWLALGSGINGNVKALAVNETELYAAGSFTTAGGIPSNNIAKWDGSSWSPLVNSNGSNGVSGGIVASDITALSMIGDDLYAAGYFSTAGGVSANHIAKWDGTNWSALGNGIYGANIYTDAIVSSLATNGTDLIAAGAFSMAGNINASNIAKYSCSGTLTSVDDDNTINIIPQQFLLSQNYPNPFNPTTTIRYDIPKAVFVKITIYDILGREIKVLVNEEKNPGVYEVKFDAKNLASGVYFYTIRTGDFIQSKKMILMK